MDDDGGGRLMYRAFRGRNTDREQRELKKAMDDALAELDISGNIGGHPIAQRPQQQFMSNACIHDDHDQCETECGYCHDGCACSCHPWAGAAPEDDQALILTFDERERPTPIPERQGE